MLCKTSPAMLQSRCISRPMLPARPAPRIMVRPKNALDSVVSNGVVVAKPAELNGASLAMPAPAPAPAAPAPILALQSPAGIYMTIAEVGGKKAQLPPMKTLVMGIVAGVYIGFGGMLAFSVLSNMPGLLSTNPGLAKLISASVFPLGLSIITILGAELYTGNTAALPVAIFEGKATIGQLCKNWFFSYIGNVIGSLAFFWLVCQTGVFNNTTVLPNVAAAKTSLDLGTLLARSMICNWLVNIAVWMAASSSTLPGKLMGLWMPITAFVAVGLEHSVANMFIIPLGSSVGGGFIPTLNMWLTNIIPVSIGNTIAGLVFATYMSYFHGALGRSKDAPKPARV